MKFEHTGDENDIYETLRVSVNISQQSLDYNKFFKGGGGRLKVAPY